MLDLWEKIFSHQKNGRWTGNLIANMIFESLEVFPEFEAPIQWIISEWAKALQHIYQSKFPPQEAEKLAWQMVKEMQGAALLMRLFNDFSLFKTSLIRILDQL